MSAESDNPPRAYHRPVSITIETVSPLPAVRELPNETEMTVNFKGNRLIGLKLIAEISMQIIQADFFAVTITGPS